MERLKKALKHNYRTQSPSQTQRSQTNVMKCGAVRQARKTEPETPTPSAETEGPTHFLLLPRAGMPLSCKIGNLCLCRVPSALVCV